MTEFDFTTLADMSDLGHLVPQTSRPAISVLRDQIDSGRQGPLDLSQFDTGSDRVIRAKP